MQRFNIFLGIELILNKENHFAPNIVYSKFSPKQAPYILTKPLYGSQKKKVKNTDGLTITIELVPNYELKSLLLSFGENVKIISPLWLDEELKRKTYPK